MRKLLAVAAAGALAACLGCNPNATPGGPGATNRGSSSTHLGQAENTFTLSTPTLSTSIKQGEKKPIKISINRGKNFSEDVALSFSGLPDGVTITPAKPTLPASEKETTVNLEAGKEAALGDFTITATGKPSKGEDAASTFKITVKKP